MNGVYALVLAGGGGTRLWPASRKLHPKQFLPLLPGGRTLLGATVERLLPIVPLERILIVTAADQVDAVAGCLPNLPRANIVAEPAARNTAAAIGLGAVVARGRDAKAVLAVIPSDQYVTDGRAYQEVLRQALDAARTDKVVTVGLRPDRPEIGFGYLEFENLRGVQPVKRFVEKPDLETAKQYVSSGRYLWNSGMFFFTADRILAELRTHLPPLGKILDEVARAPEKTAALYPTAPSISIDYGVMEKLAAGEVYVVSADMGWSDVGSWSALFDIAEHDAKDNVGVGDAIAIDSARNVVYSSGKQLIAAVGVSDLVIVATDDAVLVMPLERAQDVKEVVAALKAQKRENLL